jgi:hypothetical protein
VAGVLAVLFLNAAKAAAATSGSPDAGAPEKPGYDVAADARDPFFFPRDDVPVVAAPTAGPSVQRGPREVLADLVGRLRISGLVEGRTAATAIIDGRLYSAGDTISIEADGRTYALSVVRFRVDPPAVILGFEGQEAVLAVPEKGNGDE